MSHALVKHCIQHARQNIGGNVQIKQAAIGSSIQIMQQELMGQQHIWNGI